MKQILLSIQLSIQLSKHWVFCAALLVGSAVAETSQLGLGKVLQAPKLKLSQVYSLDYVGRQLLVSTTLQTKTVSLGNCNPNSVAVNQNLIYVVCNSDWGNPDAVQVYNQKYQLLKTIRSSEFNSLVAIAFDAANNAWISSINNHSIVKLSAASLASANPTVSQKLEHSPDSPIGLAFDTDGSLWVSSVYAGGLVLNIAAQDLASSQYSLDVSPRYCISNAAAGCQTVAGLFDVPEGIAVWNNAVWVANNGGNHPAHQLVRLTVSGNQLSSRVYGQAVAQPFYCPGGLFATPDALWLNDQGFGKANTSCGATAEDQAGQTGAILRLTTQTLNTPNPAANDIVWGRNLSSRPGFGGLFILP